MTVITQRSPIAAEKRARRVVRDFWWIEALNSLRLPVTARTFRALAVVLAAIGFITFVAVLLAVLKFVRLAVADDAAYSAGLVLVAWATSGGAVILGWCREVLTERRYSVSRSPNISLFRALDLSALAVLTVYRLVPILLAVARSAVIVVLLLLCAHLADPLPLTTWIGPMLFMVVAGVLSIALAVENAAEQVAAQRRRDAALPVAVLVVGSVALGIWMGNVAAAWVDRGVPPVVQIPPALVTVGLAALIPLVAVAGVRVARNVRFLTRAPFALRSIAAVVSPSREREATSTVADLALFHKTVRAVRRHGSGSWQYAAIARIAASVGFIMLGIVSMRIGGFEVSALMTEDFRHVFAVSALYLTAVITVAVQDLQLSATGGNVMAGHLRSAWERGSSVSTLVSAVGVVLLAPGVIAGAGFAIAATACGLGGAAWYLGVGGCISAGSVIAESIVPPSQNADDSGSMQMVNVFISLLLTVPILVANYFETPFTAAASIAYAAALITGAFSCLRSRILSRASGSMR